MTREEAINILWMYDVNFEPHPAEEVMHAIDMAIEALRQPERKTGRWIPVTERLPEKPNMYTVTDSKGDVVRFVFNDTESSRKYWLRCVKAWMPLPEPYREGGEADG